MMHNLMIIISQSMVAFIMYNLNSFQSMVACLPSFLSSLSLPQFDMQETVWAQIILKVGRNDKNSETISLENKNFLGHKYDLTNQTKPNQVRSDKKELCNKASLKHILQRIA